MPPWLRFCIMSVVSALALGTTPIAVWIVQQGVPDDAGVGAIAPLALSVGAMVAAMALPATAALSAVVFAVAPLAARRLRISQSVSALLVTLIAGVGGAAVAIAGWPGALNAMAAPFHAGPYAPLIGGVMAGTLIAPWAAGGTSARRKEVRQA